MSISVAEKKEIIEKFKKTENDTGSSEVQVALLTTRINKLAGHFQLHGKDHSSRRGLIKMVSLRRRLLQFIKNRDLKSYQNIITELEIRG